MKKIAKICLIMIFAFTCMFSVKADEMNNNASRADDIASDYAFYERVYRLIGAMSYYHDHAAVFDTSDSKTGEENFGNIWKDAMAKFGVDSDASNRLKSAYNSYKSGTATSSVLVRDYFLDIAGSSGLRDEAKLATYQAQLINFDNLPAMFKYSKNWLSAQVKTYENLCANANPSCSSTDIKTKYENLMDDTTLAYSSICDKLKDSPGIKYYLNTALKLISYAALVLAVVLGSLDFIKAITSHDDAALTKAFQTFVKRLVAVALIFMTYVIVQAVIGLMTSVPGATTDTIELCDEFKMGLIK